MSTALAQRLIASGAVSAADAEAALLSSLARRVPFVRALIDTGAIAEAVLDQEIEQLGGIGLRQVSGMPELVNRLPPHFCRRMGVLPVRVDHGARVVEIAAADPLDAHLAAEVSFHLGVPVRVLRAPMSSIEDAIRRIELQAEAAAGRTRRATPPFPHGAPESSNPPPPPLPAERPIPLVKKVKPAEKPPDTLRLYKQSIPPGEESADLDFAGGTRPPSDGAPPPSQPEPGAPLLASLLPDSGSDSSPRTLRGMTPAPQDFGQVPAGVPFRPVGESTRLRELAQAMPPEALSRSVRESTRLRELAQALPSEAPSRAVRESTPRLRDLVQAPQAERLRDLPLAAGADAAPTTTFEAPPEKVEGPVSAMVSADQVSGAGGEPPAVSFPSMPPPSLADEPGLLAAEEEDWSTSAPLSPAPPSVAPVAPTPPPRPVRIVRPSINIQIPQPPSERSRRQRTIWDVPMGGDAAEDEGAEDDPHDPTPQPPAPLPSRADRLDVGPVLEVLRVAGSRDDVVTAGLRGLRTVGRRVAVFVVRRDGFHGWACNVELGDQQKLRNVSIAHDAPSLFATAVAAGSYFGPVPPNAVHAALLGVLEQPASDVAAAVVRAGGKPVMVLFADDLVDIKRRVLPRLDEIAGAVGAALSRLLAARL